MKNLTNQNLENRPVLSRPEIVPAVRPRSLNQIFQISPARVPSLPRTSNEMKQGREREREKKKSSQPDIQPAAAHPPFSLSQTQKPKPTTLTIDLAADSALHLRRVRRCSRQRPSPSSNQRRSPALPLCRIDSLIPRKEEEELIPSPNQPPPPPATSPPALPSSPPSLACTLSCTIGPRRSCCGRIRHGRSPRQGIQAWGEEPPCARAAAPWFPILLSVPPREELFEDPLALLHGAASGSAEEVLDLVMLGRRRRRRWPSSRTGREE